MSEIQQYIQSCFDLKNDLLVSRLAHTCYISPYFKGLIDTHPGLIQSLINDKDLERSYQDEDWDRIRSGIIEDSIASSLRKVRKREYARIIFRDLNRCADLEETMADLSSLAEICISAAHDHFYNQMCIEQGVPLGATGEKQSMSILALGKLGAKELNLSSDVDLIFLYDQSGWLNGEENKLSNQEFFLQLSRKIIHCLSDVTAEGFVFRVDMRLRPYGESSALILNRNAMEQYYLSQGRDWERYAFVKARAIAGDIALGLDFLQWINPFVFRKHLDYGAIESLREMKEMINHEVRLKNLGDDLKLGPGGIREIEFVVQANQLICGGRDSYLQESSLLHNLEVMCERDYLPYEDKITLTEAYVFLRNSEHAIQAENDKQTHQLPAEDISRERLALALDCDSWNSYLSLLERHRQGVKECFSRIIDSGERETSDLLETHIHWQIIWRESIERESLENYLENTAFENHEAFTLAIKSLKAESEKLAFSSDGKERLDRLVPILLGFINEQHHADEVLHRVLPIIRSIMRRSTYVLFLLENLDALQRMIFLCGMSHWLADQLVDFPVLLYELTDKQFHEAVFDKEHLSRELEQMMDQFEQGDLESRMDAMRQFKQAWVLKVAVNELLDSLPIMKASDVLTWVAEIILAKAIEVAWWHLVQKHGGPDESSADKVGGFSVLAYGKLGGFELGYKSDLDLVFVHNHDMHGETAGEQPVNVNTFFVRLAQRLVHILTSHTRFGVLYQVDLRLRPSGNKGPLVATLNAFQRYQEENAWTWEHQALVRARFVAGDPDLGASLESIRQNILCRERNEDELRKDVVSMREKMRQHLSPRFDASFDASEEGVDILVSGFDLKHGLGAIVDIEFMVQYAVLAWSWKFPDLGKWTDKMRILDELRKLELFPEEETALLQSAYLNYRSAVHYQSLGGRVESFDLLEETREKVAAVWENRMQSS